MPGGAFEMPAWRQRRGSCACQHTAMQVCLGSLPAADHSITDCYTVSERFMNQCMGAANHAVMFCTDESGEHVLRPSDDALHKDSLYGSQNH